MNWNGVTGVMKIARIVMVIPMHLCQSQLLLYQRNRCFPEATLILKSRRRSRYKVPRSGAVPRSVDVPRPGCFSTWVRPFWQDTLDICVSEPRYHSFRFCNVPQCKFQWTLRWRHMNVMEFQITDHSTVCLIANTDPHQRNINVRITGPLWGKFTGDLWIHRKGPVTRKSFHLMTSSWNLNVDMKFISRKAFWNGFFSALCHFTRGNVFLVYNNPIKRNQWLLNEWKCIFYETILRTLPSRSLMLDLFQETYKYICLVSHF